MKTLALLLAAAAVLSAQEFEVASIHPAKDDGDQDSDVNRGRYSGHNLEPTMTAVNLSTIEERP